MSENLKNTSKNIGRLMQSAKFRVIATLIFVAAVAGVVFAAWHHLHQKNVFKSTAVVAATPGIESVPGAGNPSNTYVHAQNVQNSMESQQARKKATSFVPTITRSSFIGSPDAFNQDPSTLPTAKKPFHCPLSKVVYMYKPNPASCTVDNLKLARKAGVTAEELRCQSCSCPALRLAGYTVGELKDTGYSAADLRKCGFTLGQLKLAGFNAADLKAAGFSAKQLRDIGFGAGQLASAGFTPEQLASVGYSPSELRAAGVETDVDCSVAALKKARAAGVSAAVLRKKGCGLPALKAAGYSALDLKNAGFSDADLKKAGFTPAQIKMADRLSKICSVSALKAARAQGVTAATLKNNGCGLAALKAAGFTAAELRDAGFTAKQLKDAGFSAAELKAAGFNAAQLKAAGFDATQLKDAGFSSADLQAAGFTPSEIKAAELSSTACSVDALKKARMEGISAVELRDKGCGLAALKAAGYSAAELKAAGFTAKQLKDAGFSAADLKAAGFTAAQLKAAGFDAKALRDAGFSAADLKAAGFTPAELKAAGFSAKELAAAGFNAAQLSAAGFSAQALKDAGFSAQALKAAGFSAGQLRAAGFTAQQLKAVGFDAKQLRDAGFSAAALKSAGYSAEQLHQAGFTKGDLLRAGYSPEQAGYHTQAPSVQTVERPTHPVDNNTQASASMPSVNSNTPDARLRAIQKLQQEELSRQQQRDMMQQMQGQMSLQAQKLMVGWSNAQQQVYTPGEQPPVNTGGKDDGKGSQQSSGPVVKAGTVMFAVLDTGVNSDEKSPILATIVTGPLKGAKVIGNFERVNTKVLMKFNVMNVPRFQHTFSINSVAIDPNTARTAVSGSVNNHYLLRYGTLFASAFVSGLSQGIIQSGSTQDCFFGICHTTYQKLSPAQYVALGLGNVGEQYANVMSQNFNTPPTVKIAGGSGIGLLFMSDVTLPQPLAKHPSLMNVN